MRIVIDGAAGSGKTTFLSCNYLRNNLKKKNDVEIPTIINLGYKVFSELIQGSVNQARKYNIIPPKKTDEWNKLFEIIYNRGKLQYEESDGENICWYDRGLPFIAVFAKAHGIEINTELLEKIKMFRYDYIFIFEPIASYDLSMKDNGKFQPLSLEDRYIEFERTKKIYEELGYQVYTVPFFSENLLENFKQRYEFIKNIIPDLKDYENGEIV